MGEQIAQLPLGSLLGEATTPCGGGSVLVLLPSGKVGLVDTDDIAAWPRERGARDTLMASLDIWTGQPYVWGGTNSLTGADCSGLVYRTYQRSGYVLPRDASDQFDMAPEKEWGPRPDGAEEGDLVFFQRPESRHIDHVGVYLGDGRYLSANQAAGGISVRAVGQDAYVGWARYLPPRERVASAV